ncbi:MAG: sporulation initiation inhibitor Soj, partial [Sulfobacillus thermosulfidooxidans]
LLSTIELVKSHLNPTLALEGILLTMFDGRTNLATQVADEVRNHFTSQVYQSVIPRTVRLSEAPSHGLPIMRYDPKSRGAEGYRALAEEVMAHG